MKKYSVILIIVVATLLWQNPEEGRPLTSFSGTKGGFIQRPSSYVLRLSFTRMREPSCSLRPRAAAERMPSLTRTMPRAGDVIFSKQSGRVRKITRIEGDKAICTRINRDGIITDEAVNLADISRSFQDKKIFILREGMRGLLKLQVHKGRITKTLLIDNNFVRRCADLGINAEQVMQVAIDWATSNMSVAEFAQMKTPEGPLFKFTIDSFDTAAINHPTDMREFLILIITQQLVNSFKSQRATRASPVTGTLKGVPQALRTSILRPRANAERIPDAEPDTLYKSERLAIAIRSFDHGPATDILNALQILLAQLSFIKDAMFPEPLEKEIENLRREIWIFDNNIGEILTQVITLTTKRLARPSEVKRWRADLTYFRAALGDIRGDFKKVHSQIAALLAHPESTLHAKAKTAKNLKQASENLNYITAILENRIRFCDNKISPETIDLKKLGKNACHPHVGMKREQMWRGVRFQALSREPLYVVNETISLLNAFANIVVNATDELHERDDAAINVEVSRQGRFAVVTISDNGSGIAPHLLGMRPNGRLKLFDLNITTKEGGTGLGLAEAWYVILKAGGRIEVKSEPGKGTTFTVYLPAVDISPQTPSPDPEKLIHENV
jgi:signal transduction histidine kinase